MKSITNHEDIIDSRDIIARLEELREIEADVSGDEWANDFSDEAAELGALEALAEECEGYGDWEYGEALIRDSYFPEYAEELADDICANVRDAKWPLNHIDWESAAAELKQDYISVDFDGVEYWMRY